MAPMGWGLQSAGIGTPGDKPNFDITLSGNPGRPASGNVTARAHIEVWRFGFLAQKTIYSLFLGRWRRRGFLLFFKILAHGEPSRLPLAALQVAFGILIHPSASSCDALNPTLMFYQHYRRTTNPLGRAHGVLYFECRTSKDRPLPPGVLLRRETLKHSGP